VGKVRLIRQTKVVTQTLHNVKVTVEAPDGSLGLFMPKPRTERHLPLAPTLARVPDGSIRVSSCFGWTSVEFPVIQHSLLPQLLRC
jgi:hypothetical protein